MENTNPHEKTIRRAALPELMFPTDVALALGIPEEEAAEALRSGCLGPFLQVRGRPAILRRDLVAALKERADRSPEEGKEVLP